MIMDSKQIKNALKAAREAIRNKEFKEALRQCKVILAEDKENYMALVLVAVAAEGLEQFDQALKAYKRAIEADESQVLAWQGLSSFYEKQDSTEHIPDRLKVYLKLIQLYKGDGEKSHDCLMKAAKLVDKKTEPELVEKIVTLCTDAEKSETAAERRKDLQFTLINLLQFSNLPERKEKMLDEFGGEKHAQQFFEVLQSVMKGDVDKLAIMAQAANLPYFWEILIEMYLKNGLMQEAEGLVQQSISSTSNRKSLLIRLANALYLKAVESGKESERSQFDAIANQILSLDRNCSPVFLMQGVLNLKNNIRQSRYQIQDVCRQEVDGHVTGSRKFGLSVARRALIYILKSTKKDPETLERLVSDAEYEGDMETLQYLQQCGH